MKKLPLGLQTFSKLMQGDYLYIDKTKYIHTLIQGNCYFFARPRRFGKSLLCSTIIDIFQGKKELFKGLWIGDNLDHWPVHPVIHIDFTIISYKTPQELRESLMRFFSKTALEHGLPALEFSTPGEMLELLMVQLLQKYGQENKVVLIIDEYDKPILEHLHSPSVAEEMRDTLRALYGFIKGLDKHLRFVFITGVSRFSKTSVFSGLNQLVDISMDPRYANLVGLTQAEIAEFCALHLENAAVERQETSEYIMQQLTYWYNGYRFWAEQRAGQEKLARVYSPISIISFFDKLEFQNYWFGTGTPTFLIKLIQKNQYPVESFDGLKANLQELATFEVDDLPLTTILYQAGYLTIKEYDKTTDNYVLSFPNHEVEDSLLKRILMSLANIEAGSTVNIYASSLKESLQNHDLKSFISFLLNKSASIALQQIKDKGYYQKYLSDKRPITLIGINFSSTERNIAESVIEELNKESLR